MSRASSQPFTKPAASLIPSGSEESYAIRRSASERSSAPGAFTMRLGAFGDRQERLGSGLLALGLVGRRAALLGVGEPVVGLGDAVLELARVEVVGRDRPRRPARSRGSRRPAASPRRPRSVSTSLSDLCRRSSDGTSRASTGTCRARIPISPVWVFVESCSSSPSKTSPSGVRTRAWSLCSSAISPRLAVVRVVVAVLGIVAVLRVVAFGAGVVAVLLLGLRVGVFLLGLRAGLLVLGLALRSIDDLVDRALHVEGALGDVVEVALDQLLEPGDRVADRDVLAVACR